VKRRQYEISQTSDWGGCAPSQALTYLFVGHTLRDLGRISAIAQSILLERPGLIEAWMFLVGTVQLVVTPIPAQITLPTSAVNPFDSGPVSDIPLGLHAGAYRNDHTGTFVASNALTRVLHPPLKRGPVIAKQAFV
jgi:hypothetical protein